METVTLTIGESRPKKWKPMSFLIMLIEGVDHSHSFVSWEDPRLEVRKVAEARGSGGRIISNFEFKRTNHVVRCHQYNIPMDRVESIEKFIWNNLKGYSFKQVIGIFIIRIAKVFGKKIHNPFSDGNKSMICVELSANVIKIARDLDIEIEDLGMVETHELNIRYRDSEMPQDIIDRINGKK